MDNKIIIECKACSGTGLYKGECERDKSAVVCYECRGKGWVYFSYNTFLGRKERENVKRVFKTAHMYILSHKDVILKKGDRLIPFSKMGCSYEDWKKGFIPKPLDFLVCPRLESGQEFNWEKCDEHPFGYIPDCPHYKDKELCWFEYRRIHNYEGPIYPNLWEVL
jgi:hypothetical protein